MKKLFTVILLGLFTLPSALLAIDLKQSKFTQVVNDVEVISADKSHHQATANDVFKMPDVLRTGPNSRAELVSTDNTITRVGANTVFAYDPASRTLDLQQGSLLFHSLTGKGGGTIHTRSATASVLGTTIIVSATPNGGFKLLVLEGQAEVRFLNGQHRTLFSGQMIFILPGGEASPVIVFRLDVQTQGSLLVNGFNTPLPSWSKIQNSITQQLSMLLNGEAQDSDFSVGDNATPDAVQVVMNVYNNYNHQGFLGDASIIGGDKVVSDHNAVDYPSLSPLHLANDSRAFSSSFTLPNTGNVPMELGLLGINNPAAGFVGNNIDIDTENIYLSPFANDSDFDFIADGDLKIWQSVNFTPGGSGSFGGGSPTIQPYTIALVAGQQMLIAPGVTLEADTGIFDLVADSFGVLETGAGEASPPELLSDANLLNVNLINQVGDVDVYSLAGLSLTGGGVNADGNVKIESKSTLALEGDNEDEPSFLVIDAGGSLNLISDTGDVDINGAMLNPGSEIDINANGAVNLSNSNIHLGIGEVNINAVGFISQYGNDIEIDAGDLNVTAGGSVVIDNTTINAGNSISIDSEPLGSLSASTITILPGGPITVIPPSGDLNVTSGGETDIENTTINLGGNLDIQSGGALTMGSSGSDTITVSESLTMNSTCEMDIENSEISANNNNNLNISDAYFQAYGSFNINAVNNDNFSIHSTDDDVTLNNSTVNLNGNVTIENSTLYSGFGYSGGEININGGIGAGVSGSDIYINNSTITGGNLSIVDSQLTVQYGDVNINNNGSISFSTTDVSPNNSISGSTISLNNLSISGSTVTADGGDVNIESGGSISFFAQNHPGISDSMVSVKAISISDSSLDAYGSSLDYSSGGLVDISGAGNMDIDNTSIYGDGDVDLESGGTLTLRISSGNTITAGSAVNLISDNGDVDIYNATILENNGNDVNVYADYGNLILENSIFNAEGGANIEVGGNILIGDDSFLNCYGDVNITAGNSSSTSEGADINIETSSVNAGYDPYFLQGSTSGGSASIITDGGNVFMDGATIQAFTGEFVNNNGNVTIYAGGNVNLESTYISAGGSLTINAGMGLTVSGTSLNANNTSGTITLNNTIEQTTINNGSSMQAFYITVDSPDGILLDGSSGTISGNSLTLSSGNAAESDSVTVQNANLCSFASVNLAAHTLNVYNTTFGGGSSVNLGSETGILNINDESIPFDINLVEDNYGRTPITSSGQFTSGYSTSPGLHNYAIP